MTTALSSPKLVAVAFGIVTMLIVGCHSDPKAKAEEYRSYLSPDNRFKLVVYRIPMTTAMPGAASDAPSFVRLYDTKTGSILEEKNVEMVQMISNLNWSPTNLLIISFADWKLPQ